VTSSSSARTSASALRAPGKGVIDGGGDRGHIGGPDGGTSAEIVAHRDVYADHKLVDRYDSILIAVAPTSGHRTVKDQAAKFSIGALISRGAVISTYERGRLRVRKRHPDRRAKSSSDDQTS
jgi:hypothetical protein